MKLRSSYIALALALFTLSGGSCSREPLVQESVVEQYYPATSSSELTDWIASTFAPYNIEVQHHWYKQNIPSGSIATPPRPEQVRPVLEAIKMLALDLYELPKAGGAGFLRDKGLLRLTLLGGSELQSSGVLLRLWYAHTASNELFAFDTNGFDPKDRASLYRLMRSIHHQIARRLIEHTPYDRDAFATISPNSYGTLGLAPSRTEVYRRVGLSPYAHRRGFYTLHSMSSPEDEFAEIVSIMLMHSAVELDAAERTALTPTGEGVEAEQEAKQAHRAMLDKRAFVEQYFRSQLGISLSRLQILSQRQLALYYTQHQTN